MDEDVIVVDDIGAQLQRHSTRKITQSTQKKTHPTTATTPRLRSANHPQQESSERTTRSTNAKPKIAPKLKLKLSEKAAAQAPGTSFLGQYDRELDSSDDDIAFEEQFILRLPPGDDLDKLRKMVATREVTPDVWFKFKGML
jgi:transcription initiation factor TFIID subunit 7